MNSGNWIIDNIVNALNVWNDKLQEIWQITTQSPENFKGGGLWGVVLNINAALKAQATHYWYCSLWSAL